MREGGRTGGREDGTSGGSIPPVFPSSRLPVWSRLRSAFKQIVGMPDYARYLEHANLEHPHCRRLSEREFYDQYLAQRYGGGATRCC
jgi:uncharacterized short protein YbdD (DUF466 family)